MNILILGHKGFIGKRIIKNFSSKGYYKIFTIDARLLNTKQIILFIKNNDIQIIIHLVSNLIPASNKLEFEKSITSLVEPTFELIDYSAIHSIKFVFFSSGGAVYGNHELKKIDEQVVCNPINYYGYSKLIIENYIKFKFHIDKLSYLILRPSNVYGIGQNYNVNQGFISLAITKAIKDEEIVVWGDGENVKNYIYVDDVVSILDKLLLKNVNNEIFNISSDVNYSLNNILSIISQSINKELKIKYVNSKEFDTKNILLSNEKMRKIIDFDFTELPEGISRQIEETKMLINER